MDEYYTSEDLTVIRSPHMIPLGYIEELLECHLNIIPSARVDECEEFDHVCAHEHELGWCSTRDSSS